ncbi:hypothetical protein OsJ_29994 [Oryza sativa Japonica Group]|uniref:DUF1618 domain-containing protein n=1 Tax=Oryza sativa subsp. japonica TaxID=39947 RepID=B9G4J2_ORYSJ|nr:hypothetical protein OsJ_29994 [Oryza sativa Japonica Group]
MGLSRRFQNLIVDSSYAGAQWLRSIDLTRHLFGNTAAAAPAADSYNPKNKRGLRIQIERIRFPRPMLRLKCTYMPYDQRNIDCFPLADRKVVMVDHTGITRLCDVDARSVMAMPNIHKPKSDPISLFVPSSGGGSLYVMERYPDPEDGTQLRYINQFEAFVWGKSSCHCHLLSSGLAKEMPLPFFSGKLEYVPELKLWFGLSAEPSRRLLAAADLISSDSQPQLIGDWNEFAPPEGWLEYQEPQLVNLGSARFCISRFFHIRSMDNDNEVIDSVVVFTGVEVMPVGHNGDGNGKSPNRVVRAPLIRRVPYEARDG